MTDYIADYRTWLQEEKHASDNTLSSYLRDINQFKTWLLGAGSPDLRRVKKDTINEYMLYLSGAGKSPRDHHALHGLAQVVLRLYARARRGQNEPGQERRRAEGGAQVPRDPHEQRGGAVSRAAEVR